MSLPDSRAVEGYEEIGSLLRSAREESRMSLDQAARLLHIRLRYIVALEQGQLHEIPGLTYTRGYLQAYAAFLGLDKEEVLRRFEEVERQLKQKHIYFPQSFSKDKTPNHAMMWGGFIVALFAYGTWLVFVQPDKPAISMVEPVEKTLPTPKRDVISAKSDVVSDGFDPACFRPQSLYYPSCLVANEPDPRISPMSSTMMLSLDFIADFLALDTKEVPQ